MGKEIERKFLVRDLHFLQGTEGHHIVQCYLVNRPGIIVRIRIMDDKAWLTVKGPTVNCTRREEEFELPVDEAKAIMGNMKDLKAVEKKRYIVDCGKRWEIDVFEGENAGMVVAEIELNTVDEQFDKPEWLGEEVSDDPRYYNSNLINNPYSKWK